MAGFTRDMRRQQVVEAVEAVLQQAPDTWRSSQVVAGLSGYSVKRVAAALTKCVSLGSIEVRVVRTPATRHRAYEQRNEYRPAHKGRGSIGTNPWLAILGLTIDTQGPSA